MYNDMLIGNADFAKTLQLEWARLNKEQWAAASKMDELRMKWHKALEVSKVMNTDLTVQAENEAWEEYDEAAKWFELVNGAVVRIVDLMRMYKGEGA